MNKINYIELGATLFVPATHKSLEAILRGEKYPTLRSVLIDYEDGISTSELQEALNVLKKLLLSYKKGKLFVFVRPRNAEVLKDILALDMIEKIDGFILPKFSLRNASRYLNQFETNTFSLMPSIEGEELFDFCKLTELRDILLHYKERVVLVRFGLQDLLKQLDMKRSCFNGVFDLSAPSVVVGNFIATFKSAGFGVSGGVYPCFNDREGFIKDVKRDLKEGLFSKTIIHPNHIDITNELYKVTFKEFEEATEILKSKEAAFAQDGRMAEPITMVPYSLNIVKRAEVYGVLPLP
jgi:citrate lyase beta subunit